MIRAEVELMVPFHDVDMLGIAWHGHFCKYLEIVRCEMLDKIDYDFGRLIPFIGHRLWIFNSGSRFGF